MKAGVIFSLFFLCWIIMSGIFNYLFILFGLLSCIFVIFVSCTMGIVNPALKEVKYFSLFLYFCWLVKEIIISSFNTMKLILFNKEVKPVVISFKPKCKKPFQLMLLANSITLTPGTVSILVSMDKITIHALNQEMADSVHAINNKVGDLI